MTQTAQNLPKQAALSILQQYQGFIFGWLKPGKLCPLKRHFLENISPDTSQARVTHWVPPGTQALLLGGISMLALEAPSEAPLLGLQGTLPTPGQETQEKMK